MFPLFEQCFLQKENNNKLAMAHVLGKEKNINNNNDLCSGATDMCIGSTSHSTFITLTTKKQSVHKRRGSRNWHQKEQEASMQLAALLKAAPLCKPNFCPPNFCLLCFLVCGSMIAFDALPCLETRQLSDFQRKNFRGSFQADLALQLTPRSQCQA